MTSTWTRRSLVWLLLAVGLLAAWYRLRILRPLWQCALVLLVAADLLTFARDYHPRLSSTDLAPRSRVVEFLRDNNGLHRAYVAWPVTLLGPNRLLPYAIAEAGGYSSLVTQRYNNYVAAMQKQPQRLLDLMNVRYIVASPQSSQGELTGAVKVFEEGTYAIYERAPLPRAFLVNQAHFVMSSKDALHLLGSEDFDPRTSVVVEGAPPATSHDAAGERSTTTGAVILSYSAEAVVVQTEAEQPGYLVLSDTYYPGWQAEIDGIKAPIMRADYLFRAVQIPSGRHVVHFHFRSPAVAAGAIISSISGVLIVLMGGLAVVSSPSGRGRKKKL